MFVVMWSGRRWRQQLFYILIVLFSDAKLVLFDKDALG